jgi:hypothetical protein
MQELVAPVVIGLLFQENFLEEILLPKAPSSYLQEHTLSWLASAEPVVSAWGRREEMVALVNLQILYLRAVVVVVATRLAGGLPGDSAAPVAAGQTS